MRTGRPKRSLELTVQERADLEAVAGSRSLPHGLVRRAQMILWTEAGMAVTEAARRLKLTAAAVGSWRRRFRAERLPGLHDRPKSGRPRSVDEERIAGLLNTALRRKPKAATHWSVRTLEAETGVSKSSVQRYLALFGVQPHRSKSFKLSNDPFFIEKVRDIVGLYLNPPDKALVLCVDEKSQVQALERTQPVLPMGLGYLEGVNTRLLPPWHNHPVCRPRRGQRPGLRSVQAAPSPSGVPRVPAPSRGRGSKLARRASHRRQLRHPQAPEGARVADAPSALSVALPPDLQFLAQPGRTLVRVDHPARDPSRLVHLRDRPAPPHRELRRGLESPSSSLHVDRDGRIHPRKN